MNTSKLMIKIVEEFKRLKIKSQVSGMIHDSILFDIFPGENEIVNRIVKQKTKEVLSEGSFNLSKH